MQSIRKDVVLYIGARPNVPKARVIGKALTSLHDAGLVWWQTVHTGQHYTHEMCVGLCEELGVKLDHVLDPGRPTSDAMQLGALMQEVERNLEMVSPDIVVVIGDTNSAVAAAVIGKRRGCRLVHLEAGLRSFDLDQEEINRKVITACADYHFCSTEDAVTNLIGEGIKERDVYFVGNTMAETFYDFESIRKKCQILNVLDVVKNDYILVTFHKPQTLAHPNYVSCLLKELTSHSKVVLVCHPRTVRTLGGWLTRLMDDKARLVVSMPLGYVQYTKLIENARFVVTDSSGTQEETSIAGVPCLTLSASTARPVTTREGTNRLISCDSIRDKLNIKKDGRSRIKYWDTNVSDRIDKSLRDVIRRIT